MAPLRLSDSFHSLLVLAALSASCISKGQKRGKNGGSRGKDYSGSISIFHNQVRLYMSTCLANVKGNIVEVWGEPGIRNIVRGGACVAIGCCQAYWYVHSLYWYCNSQLISLESEKSEGAQTLTYPFPGLKTRSILCFYISLYNITKWK